MRRRALHRKKRGRMLASRRSILRSALAAAAVCAGPTFTRAAGKSLLLRELIDLHTRARGGAKRLDAVKSLLIYPTITENGSALRARYLCSDEPAWRIDVYSENQHVFCEGLDAKGPWLWPGGDAGPREAVQDAKKTGIQGIEFNLYGLHRFPSRGHTLSLDGRELVDGVDYYLVRVVMKEGYETYLYIHPHTWMIERRRDFRAFHPDVDPKKVYAEKVYGDFRSADGIVSAFSEVQRNWKTGEIVNSTRVVALKYNPKTQPGELTRSFVAPKHLVAS